MEKYYVSIAYYSKLVKQNPISSNVLNNKAEAIKMR